MKKNNRRFLIFMFSITATFVFIAVDVVTHSTPNGKGVTSVSWVGPGMRPSDTIWDR